MRCVVGDHQRAPGGQYDPAAAYVAIWCVTSLSGLAILRDFEYADISTGRSEEQAEEERRLYKLGESTIAWLHQVRLSNKREINSS